MGQQQRSLEAGEVEQQLILQPTPRAVRIVHLAVLHRTGVVDPDVVEQPPRDLGLRGRSRLGQRGGGHAKGEQEDEQAEQRAHRKPSCEPLALALEQRVCRGLL